MCTKCLGWLLAYSKDPKTLSELFSLSLTLLPHGTLPSTPDQMNGIEVCRAVNSDGGEVLPLSCLFLLQCSDSVSILCPHCRDVTTCLEMVPQG
jgi:hypothetical protein